MFRALVVIAVICVGLASARADAPFHAGGSAEAKKTPERPVDPKKIIDQLHSDFTRAGSDLDERKFNDATRATQQRILDGIDDLLKKQAPNSAKNPPKPKSENPQSAPKPAPAPAPAKIAEKPQAEPAPAETKSVAPKPAGQAGNLPN